MTPLRQPVIDDTKICNLAAGTSTAVFLAFAEQALVPTLRDRPDAIVVMDKG